MRTQDEVDFAQGEEYASRANFHAMPQQVKGVTGRYWRFMMNLMGILLLLLATLWVANDNAINSACVAVVALIWFMGARLIFPTD